MLQMNQTQTLHSTFLVLYTSTLTWIDLIAFIFHWFYFVDAAER